MRRRQLFQLKHSRRVCAPLWRHVRTKQDKILTLIQRKNTKNKSSSYSNRLRLQRLLCLLYGNLSKNTYDKIVLKAKSYQGTIASNIITLLEKRLDITLFRAGFASSILHAKQLINHRHITVNGNIVTIPSYQLKSADIFSIVNKGDMKAYMVQDYKAIHLEVNYSLMSGIFLYSPQEVSYPYFFNIVELSDLANRVK